jgi:hypothetical protein
MGKIAIVLLIVKLGIPCCTNEIEDFTGSLWYGNCDVAEKL